MGSAHPEDQVLVTLWAATKSEYSPEYHTVLGSFLLTAPLLLLTEYTHMVTQASYYSNA
jgi:hypothetical protein